MVGLKVRGRVRRIVVAWRKIFCLSSVGRTENWGKVVRAGVGGIMLEILKRYYNRMAR